MEIGEEFDETKQFVNCRYISSTEAFWHIFGFTMHSEFPPVQRLAIHLPEQERVTFRSGIPAVAAIAAAKPTTLTAWFAYNAVNTEGRQTLYHDFPKRHVFTKRGSWKLRERGTPAVGRMYWVDPTAGEQFYLRLLLTHVPGARSFEDLRRSPIDGHVCETFRQACAERGLIDDDKEIERCLIEAVSFRMPFQLRVMFATLLLFATVAEPVNLWNKFETAMCEDFLRPKPGTTRPSMSREAAVRCALRDVQAVLERHGQKLENFGLRVPDDGGEGDECAAAEPRLIREQLSWDRQELDRRARAAYEMLNKEQRVFVDAVWESVNQDPAAPDRRNFFFVESPGGCGKTFSLNMLLQATRARGMIALAVATTGIAAILLDGGTTAHHRFHIPINGLGPESTCTIDSDSDIAKLLRRTSLMLWDEVPMSHRHVLEAVERTFREIVGEEFPQRRHMLWAGVTVVVAGDRRQVAPVVPHGSRESIVAASFRMSPLWQSVRVYKLEENLRVMRLLQQGATESAKEQHDWAEWLLALGDGRLGSVVQIPERLLFKGDVGELSDWVFDNLSEVTGNTAKFARRAILTVLNEDAIEINDMCTTRFPGSEFKYLSADVDVQGGNAAMFPTEFLNTLTPQGMPPHELILKVGVPVMLLRNLDQALGMMNGTKLIVQSCGRRVIQAVRMRDDRSLGECFLIPRISLTCNSETGVQFTRRQFPIRVAFAMTINKSQGQTLERAGVYLPRPVFSHGQLYVAASRVGTPNAIRFLLPKGKTSTTNVVYTELLK